MSTTTISSSGNIVRDTTHLIQNASSSHHPPTYRSPRIPRIRLPDPPSLYPSLLTIGAGERIAKEMDRAYNARALELRSYYENSISSAFAAITDSPLPHAFEKRILDTFASLYLTKVRSWIEDGLTIYKSSQKPTKPVASGVDVPRNTNHRRAFNIDCVPLLEHFFNENPFPTHADKAFLAKKSGMTYRQIHVWFQNRRNRTKKPNGTWRKRSTHECTTLPFDTLERMRKHTVYNEQHFYPPLEVSHSRHSSEQNSTPEIHSSEKALHRMTSTVEDNILDMCAAPSHAFPSPYPPARTCEPFPPESRGEMFSAFQWARRPNHDTSSHSRNTDINNLADRFSLLGVRDTYTKRFQIKCGGIQDSLAATCSITTRPPAAPHPALIKSIEVISSLARRPAFPIVRALQPIRHAFTMPKSSTPILPPSHLESFSSRRNASPLQRQYTHQSPLSCRGASPAMSDVSSSTPSPCPSLCSWSDSFDSQGRHL